MNYKVTSNIFLFSLIILGIAYFYSASNLPSTKSATMGADYFPKLLAIILVVLCSIKLIQSFKDKNEKINYIYSKKILISILLIIIFIKLWDLFNLFYLIMFIFLMVLSSFFFPKLNYKKIGIDLIISVIVTLIIYLLFGVAMKMRF